MSTKTTYKQTELGLIPEDWEVKKLGELGKIINGLTYSPENIKENGTLVLRSSNVQNDKIVYDDNVFVEENISFNPTKKDDVLICVRNGSRGLIGKTALIDEQASNVAFGAFMAIYRSNSNNYIYNYFKSNYFFKEVHKNLGATINSINNNDLKKFKIPLPPLPEQKKIADCLSTWDSAIEKQSALINVLTQRKKALMQQLLTGKKRLPGFSDEWKEVKLGDLFEKINRKNEEGNTNVVTISAQRGFVKQTDFFNKSVASETLDNYSLIYHGEFCYNKSYSNGYPLGATKRLIAFEKAVVTTLYICFKIKDQKKSNGSFFEQFFEANSLDRSLIKIAQEGGRAHGLLNVSLSDFFNIKIKLPPIEEQTAIAEILAAADRELQLQKEKLAQLQTQKKGLMQVLLTGKKRLIN